MREGTQVLDGYGAAAARLPMEGGGNRERDDGAPGLTEEGRRLLRIHGLPVLNARLGRSSGTQLMAAVEEQAVLQVRAAPSAWDRFDSASVARALQGRAAIGSRLDPGQDALAKRAARLAVRTVYALGEDAGIVRLQSCPGGRLAVADVLFVSFPADRGDSAGKFALPETTAAEGASALAALRGTLGGAASVGGQGGGREEDAANGPALGMQADGASSRQAILLGADPEFVLCDASGHVVPASRFLPRRGTVGSDAVRTADGGIAWALAELRPAPEAEPRALLRRLHAALRLAAARIGDADLIWRAGGMPVPGLPLGGHLHFSGLPLRQVVLRALDNYLALPLVLIEDEGARRRRPRYGWLGDARAKPHGGFEYRTPPSWLASPRLAAGVFALAALIAANYRRLRAEPLRDPRLAAAYYAGDKQALLPVAQRLWRDLEALDGYARYRADLDGLKRRILACRIWPERDDFRKRWGLAPPGERQR